MKYREIERRLADLEQSEDPSFIDWVHAQADAALRELCSDCPPEIAEALCCMSDDELDRICDGRMSDTEVVDHIQRAMMRLVEGSEV